MKINAAVSSLLVDYAFPSPLGCKDFWDIIRGVILLLLALLDEIVSIFLFTPSRVQLQGVIFDFVQYLIFWILMCNSKG